MSKAEILSEIPKLSHEERREIMLSLLEAEADAQILAECDRSALERFQMLDQMEAEDERTLPGEVWRVDLGIAAKVRPVLILSDYPKDEELALLIVIPHTTAIRKTRWEVDLALPFLKVGVFHLQQIQPDSIARLESRLGFISKEQLNVVKNSVVQLLNLQT